MPLLLLLRLLLLLLLLLLSLLLLLLLLRLLLLLILPRVGTHTERSIGIGCPRWVEYVRRGLRAVKPRSTHSRDESFYQSYAM